MSHDASTERAKEMVEYWLCECGKARTTIDAMSDHVQDAEHIAELVNEETGERKAYIRGDVSRKKYRGGVPANADVRSARHGVHENL